MKKGLGIILIIVVILGLISGIYYIVNLDSSNEKENVETGLASSFTIYGDKYIIDFNLKAEYDGNPKGEAIHTTGFNNVIDNIKDYYTVDYFFYEENLEDAIEGRKVEEKLVKEKNILYEKTSDKEWQMYYKYDDGAFMVVRIRLENSFDENGNLYEHTKTPENIMDVENVKELFDFEIKYAKE